VFAKDLSLPAGYLVTCLLVGNIEELFVTTGIQLWLEHLHILVDDLLLASVAKYLADTHVALVDNTQLLLLT
jgi:hypothetical protein